MRSAVEGALRVRRRERATVLHEYRLKLAAYEEQERFQRTMREASRKSLTDSYERLDGEEAAKVYWTVTRLQRRWRKAHPQGAWAARKRASQAVDLSAPPEGGRRQSTVRAGLTTMENARTGLQRSRSSVQTAMLLSNEPVSRRPEAPFAPILLSRDEVSETLHRANMLKIKA